MLDCYDWADCFWTIAKNFAGPIATIWAAGFAGYFAHAQVKVANAQKEIARVQSEIAAGKLKLDLFERRFKVYEATRKLLQHIFEDRNLTDAMLHEFVIDTFDARFLFNAEIYEFIFDLRMRAESYARLDPEDEYYAARRNEEWLRFTRDVEGLSARFAPYMQFSFDKPAAPRN